MKTLVIFLEEPSAREMLKGLLPRLLPEDVQPRFIVFEGKQDLEKQLAGKLSGWLAPETVFLVLRDQDAGDCHEVKHKLVDICRKAGKPETVVRVACRELESWYFGDLKAVEKGLGLKNMAKNQLKAKFRQPDQKIYPAEELKKLTLGKYQKIAGSRAIGPYLNPDENQSNSFQVFINGIKKLLKNRP